MAGYRIIHAQDGGDYDPSRMILAHEAKEYAMQKRFESDPSRRVRVCFFDDTAVAFIDDPDKKRRVEAIMAWDRKYITKLGHQGAARLCFDREKFFALFAEYPDAKEA